MSFFGSAEAIRRAQASLQNGQGARSGFGLIPLKDRLPLDQPDPLAPPTPLEKQPIVLGLKDQLDQTVKRLKPTKGAQRPTRNGLPVATQTDVQRAKEGTLEHAMRMVDFERTLEPEDRQTVRTFLWLTGGEQGRIDPKVLNGVVARVRRGSTGIEEIRQRNTGLVTPDMRLRQTMARQAAGMPIDAPQAMLDLMRSTGRAIVETPQEYNPGFRAVAEGIQKKLPTGLIPPALSKALDEGRLSGDRGQDLLIKSTLQNLDPTQIPGMLDALTRPDGVERLKEAATLGLSNADMRKRIAAGDEEAMAQLGGAMLAAALGTAVAGTVRPSAVTGGKAFTKGVRARRAMFEAPPAEVVARPTKKDVRATAEIERAGREAAETRRVETAARVLESANAPDPALSNFIADEMMADLVAEAPKPKPTKGAKPRTRIQEVAERGATAAREEAGDVEAYDPVELAPQKPVESYSRSVAEPIPEKSENLTKGVETMRVEDLGVEPRLQYKTSEVVDTKNNVSGKFAGVDVYDRAKGGILTVWEDANGKRYALNSHHRRELANRAGRFVDSSIEPGKLTDVPREVPVKVLREADGWTVEKARAYGALENIADGKGTAFDAVGAMREAGLDAANWRGEFETLGINTSQKLSRHIEGLLRLPQDTMSYVRSRQLPEEFVAGVGAIDGLSATEQRLVLDSAYQRARAGDGPTTFSQGQQMAKRARGKAMQQQAAEDGLFGGGLFEGDADFASTLANLDKEAEIISTVKKRMTAARADLLKMPAELLDGETIDRTARAERATKIGSTATEAKDRVDFLFEQDRELSSTLDELAKDVVNGKFTVAQAAERLYPSVSERAAGDLRQYIVRATTPDAEVPRGGEATPRPDDAGLFEARTPEVAPAAPAVETPKPPAEVKAPAKVNLAENFLARKVIERTASEADVVDGIPYRRQVIRSNLAELLPKESSAVFHETNLEGARKLVSRFESGPRDHSMLYVSENPDLALGQGGKGVLIELDPKLVNGSKDTSKPGTDVLGGGEYVVDKSVKGAVKSLTFKTEKQMVSFAADRALASRFNFDKPVQTERGWKVERLTQKPLKGARTAESGVIDTKVLALVSGVGVGTAAAVILGLPQKAKDYLAEHGLPREAVFAAGFAAMLGGGLIGARRGWQLDPVAWGVNVADAALDPRALAERLAKSGDESARLLGEGLLATTDANWRHTLARGVAWDKLHTIAEKEFGKRYYRDPDFQNMDRTVRDRMESNVAEGKDWFTGLSPKEKAFVRQVRSEVLDPVLDAFEATGGRVAVVNDGTQHLKLQPGAIVRLNSGEYGVYLGTETRMKGVGAPDSIPTLKVRKLGRWGDFDPAKVTTSTGGEGVLIKPGQKFARPVDRLGNSFVPRVFSQRFLEELRTNRTPAFTEALGRMLAEINDGKTTKAATQPLKALIEEWEASPPGDPGVFIREAHEVLDAIRNDREGVAANLRGHLVRLVAQGAEVGEIVARLKRIQSTRPLNAEEMVAQVRSLAEDFPSTERNVESFLSNLERERNWELAKFEWEDANGNVVTIDPYESSYLASAVSYADRGWKRAAVAEQFGPDPYAIRGVLMELQKLNPEYANVMEGHVGTLLSLGPHAPKHSPLGAVARVEGAIQTVTKLTGGTTYVAQLGDLVMPFTEAGAVNFAKGIWRTFRRSAREEAALLAAADTHWMSELRGGDLEFGPRPAPQKLKKGVRQVFTRGQRSEGWVELADGVWSALQLRAVDRVVKATSLGIAIEDATAALAKATRVLEAGKQIPGALNRKLERYGLLDQVERARKEGVEAVLSDEQVQAHFAGNVRQKMVYTGNVADNPRWMSGPLASMALRFRKPLYVTSRFILRHVLSEAGRGNFTPLARFVTAGAVGGAGLTYMKDLLKMESWDDEARAMVDKGDLAGGLKRWLTGAGGSSLLNPSKRKTLTEAVYTLGKNIYDTGNAGVMAEFVPGWNRRVQTLTGNAFPDAAQVLMPPTAASLVNVGRELGEKKSDIAEENWSQWAASLENIVRTEILPARRILDFTGVKSDRLRVEEIERKIRKGQTLTPTEIKNLGRLGPKVKGRFNMIREYKKGPDVPTYSDVVYDALGLNKNLTPRKAKR